MPDPVESAARGVTKGALEWTKDEIAALAQRFKDRQVAFIRDRQTIDILHEQKRSAEYQLYKSYLKDKRLRVLCLLGLSLRKLESRPELVADAIEKVHRKHGEEGRHIVQAAQSGILGLLIGELAIEGGSPEALGATIEGLLRNIDRYVVFFQNQTDEGRKGRELLTRLQALRPPVLVIGGMGSAASMAKRVGKALVRDIDGYELVIHEKGPRANVILSRRSDL